MRKFVTMLGALALAGLMLAPTAALAKTENLRAMWQMTATAPSTGGTLSLTRLADEPDRDGANLGTWSVAAGESVVVGPYSGSTRWTMSDSMTYTKAVASLDATSSGVGTRVNDILSSVTETGDGAVHKTVITLAASVVTMADNAGVTGYGGLKVYDFPEGVIVIHGASMDLATTKSSTGINADWDGDVGLGSVTSANTTPLATTEQNFIPTTATPQAVAGVGTADAISTSTESGTSIDGTTTAVDLYLNFKVDDADHDITATAANLGVTGTITVIWSNAGDN